MDCAKVEFEGAPCLQHTNYVFYKAFKYKFDDRNKILALGDFFFLKILQEIPVCIGEIELLWEDKASNQLLASLRLYFRPEHTPDGRQDDTGEDEVVALGERLVLRLDDLIPLIQQDVKWNYGSATYCCDNSKEVEKNGSGDGSRKQDGCEKAKQEGDVWGSKDGCDSVKNGVVVKDEKGKVKNCMAVVKMENSESEIKQGERGSANLAVMSYPKYCRYRAMRKRLEGCENEWLHVAVVVAIGGFSGRAPGCRVMFCRDTFYQSEIDDLEIRMDHMLPILKGRMKGKKSKLLLKKDSLQDSDSMDEMFANVTPSISTSSRPRRSTDTSEMTDDKVSTEEQAFLIGLHKFMHEAKMPIGRIPSLGFKQIDLFYFYKQAEKLGGYDSITHKRMWKHLYDKLGGNSSNTSAATCTRKHYERLLLPYERHLRKLKLTKAKKKHHRHMNELDIKARGLEGNSHTSQTENVEVKEVKKEEGEVKKEVVESETKEDLKIFNENMKNESIVHQDKTAPGMNEHSKSDLQSDSEVLEIPMIRHRVHGNNTFPNIDGKSADRNISLQNLSLPQLEQLQQQQQQSLKSSPGLSSALPAGALVAGDNPNLSFPNMVYRGGFLVPVLPQHMLQTPWGMLAPPSSSPSALSPQIRAEGIASQSGTGLKDPSSASFPSSSKTNQNPGHNPMLNQESRSKSSVVKFPPSAQAYQQPSTSNTGGMKAAHTNTPYKPAPYLLNDHIQPARRNCRPSQHYGPSDLLGNSSHALAPILHPRPPGHRLQSHLPPAPAAIFLHPSSTNPFSPLQSPIMSSPPAAHNQPRKRPYPFDNPNPPSMGVFPSPDMVLDRIRNSTGLPRSNAAQANPSSVRQRFEDPRQIFTQTAQSFASSPNAAPSQRKEHVAQQDLHNKQLNSKSKISGRKSQQSYPGYSHLPNLELQQVMLQQQHALLPTGNKAGEFVKSANNSNGLLSVQPGSKSLALVPQTSPLASSSKDGRLTSALFGTQFTALPRTSKASELPSPQSLMVDTSSAAAAAMSLNPHLHPAFMSPYLPSGGTSTPSAMNPQLQMMASPYATTPAQLAAYEEMLRQNGYGAFLAAGGQQSKGSKKN